MKPQAPCEPEGDLHDSPESLIFRAVYSANNDEVASWPMFCERCCLYGTLSTGPLVEFTMFTNYCKHSYLSRQMRVMFLPFISDLRHSHPHSQRVAR